MFRDLTRITISTVLILVGFTANMSPGAAEPLTSAQIEARIPTALGILHEYDATRAFNQMGPLKYLESAIEILSSAVDVTPANAQTYVERRRTLLGAWAKVLRSIEESYDPRYNPRDPKNQVYNCLVPPREADGTQPPSCADPKDMTDLKARAEYVEMLRQNNVKAQEGNYNNRVSYLDGFAIQTIRADMALFRKVHAPPDTNALDNILRQAGITTQRREALDKLF